MVEDIPAITEQEFDEFLSAKTDSEQFKILLTHAEINQKIVEKKRKGKKENCNTNGKAIQKKKQKPLKSKNGGN